MVRDMNRERNGVMSQVKAHEKDFKNEGVGLPWWSSGKESAFQCRGRGFDP